MCKLAIRISHVSVNCKRKEKEAKQNKICSAEISCPFILVRNARKENGHFLGSDTYAYDRRAEMCMENTRNVHQLPSTHTSFNSVN